MQIYGADLEASLREVKDRNRDLERQVNGMREAQKLSETNLEK